MAIRVQDLAWLLEITLEGTVDDATYAAHLAEIVRALEGREPDGALTVLLHHAVKGFRATPAQNRMHAEWSERHGVLLSRTVAGFAFVVEEPLARTLTSSIFKLQPPFPVYGIFATRPEADHWARDQVQGTGSLYPGPKPSSGPPDR